MERKPTDQYCCASNLCSLLDYNKDTNEYLSSILETGLKIYMQKNNIIERNGEYNLIEILKCAFESETEFSTLYVKDNFFDVNCFDREYKLEK